MTVSTTSNRISYNGNGSTTVFSFPYKFLSASDLKVYVGGVLQVITTDYSVGTPSDAGANVTFVSAPPSGTANIVILRDPDLLQSTDLPSNGPFPASSVERMVDKVTLVAQRLADLFGRSFTLSDSDTSGASLTVPAPVAGKTLKWSPDGLSLVNSSSDPDEAAADASNFADAAAASALNAAGSEANALGYLNTFKGQYYGNLSADPSVDPLGNPVSEGDMYWNTASLRLRIYTGSAWQDTATATPASFTANTFSGTGSQTAFTLSAAPGSVQSLLVFVSGVRQTPTTDYTFSGTTLNFVSAPPLGTNNITTLVVSTLAAGVPDNGSVSTDKLQGKAVTYAKIQDISATKRVLGRNTAGAGVTEEVTLSQLLDWIGSAAQGDILFRDASGWGRLEAGTAGQFLKTQGEGANPAWASIATNGALIGFQVFTSSGTYTKSTNNPSFVIAEVVGGGGPGSASPAIVNSGGGGGGAGGYSRKKILASALASSVTVTVGGEGATSSFGTHCSATGGAAGAAVGNRLGGDGGTGSGGDINIQGGGGSAGGTAYPRGGCGGNTVFGGGGKGSNSASGQQNGFPASANTGGGGGGGCTTTTTAGGGGAGAAGIVIVWEYR